MKCIICGNELKGMKRKYCCMKCAHIAYNLGLSQPKKNTEKNVAELWGYFKRAFDMVDDKITSSNAWKMRVFVSACYELGHSPNSIAKGLHKDHSVVLFHHKKASEKEKQIASEFVKNTKHYRYINKINTEKSFYPVGFHY